MSPDIQIMLIINGALAVILAAGLKWGKLK